MAKKITQLTAVSSSQLTDVKETVQGGVSKKVTNQQDLTLFNANAQLAGIAQVTGVGAGYYVPGSFLSSNLTLTNPIQSFLSIAFTGAGFKVILPAMNASNSLALGNCVEIKNAGAPTYSFGIYKSDGTTLITTLYPGFRVKIYSTSNATSNGTFDYFVLGSMASQDSTNVLITGGGITSDVVIDILENEVEVTTSMTVSDDYNGKTLNVTQPGVDLTCSSDLSPGINFKVKCSNFNTFASVDDAGYIDQLYTAVIIQPSDSIGFFKGADGNIYTMQSSSYRSDAQNYYSPTLGSYTMGNIDNLYVILLSNHIAATISLPTTILEVIPTTFSCAFINIGLGLFTFSPGGSDTLVGPSTIATGQKVFIGKYNDSPQNSWITW